MVDEVLKPRRVLGVDPGKTGGIALVVGRDLVVHPVPILKYKLAGGKTRSRLDACAFQRLLYALEPSEAFFEDVHSMPRDGHVGAFSFGRTTGALEAILAAYLGNQSLITYVAPQTWQQAMRGSSDKAVNIRRAQTLFPRATGPLHKDGCADAALIALYGCLSAEC